MPVIEEINEAIHEYHKKWHDMVDARDNKQFFHELKPTAVGWKVADRSEYAQMLAELHDQADTIVEKWMNGRWIAKLHLKDIELDCGVTIIKIMERRPGSTDGVGLDHLDFHTPDMIKAESILQAETELKWSHESNDVIKNYTWISLWFAGTEAKIKTGTVLDNIQAELAELNESIKSHL